MADEDSSTSPFEWVAKSADPTLNEKGEQEGGYDENTAALGDEVIDKMDEDFGLMNPSKIAKTYQATKVKKDDGHGHGGGCCDDHGDGLDFLDNPSLLDSPEDKNMAAPVDSTIDSGCLEGLRDHLEQEESKALTLDQYLSRCFSLWFNIRLGLFFGFFGLIYNGLHAAVPTEEEFKLFNKKHYTESSENFPSLDSWPLFTDASYYKLDFERIKYKEYHILALARTLKKPGHYFVGVMGTWYPMPYLAQNSIVTPKSKKKKKAKTQYAWGVCVAGRCVCVPQVTPSVDFSKCQNAVWKNQWTGTAAYGGLIAGAAIVYMTSLHAFAVTAKSVVNPLYWYTFLTAPFALEQPWTVVPTLMLTGVVLKAVQHMIHSNFRIWLIFFVGSYVYAIGSLLMVWVMNDWGTMRRYRVYGVMGGFAAWMGYLALLPGKHLFTFQPFFMDKAIGLTANLMFSGLAVVDVLEAFSISRLGGLALAFKVGQALHTFFLKPF